MDTRATTRRGLLATPLLASPALGPAFAHAFAHAGAAMPPSVSVLTWSALSLPSLREAFARHLRATGTAVRHTHLPWASYIEELPEALLRPQGPDVVWLSDSWLPGMVANGWLAPLDGAPTAMRSFADLEPACRTALEVGGRPYGLPYYRDSLGLFCNMEILARAGFHAPPTRWVELLGQAHVIQARGLSAFPLIMALANEPWLLELVTALAYSFGGGFIGLGGEPVMTRGAQGIVPALHHLRASIHDHRIMSPEVLRFNEADCMERMGQGEHAFALLPGYRAYWLADVSQAPAAGDIAPALLPMGNAVPTSVTCGWVRLQAIPAAAMADPARAGRALALLNTLGGRDAGGEHDTARCFFVEHGLSFCALPLYRDAAINTHLAQAPNLRFVQENLAATARPKDTISVGSAVWQRITNPLWRQVASGGLSPEAAAESAEAAWRATCQDCGPRR